MLWPELYSMSPNSYVKFYQVPQNTTVFGDWVFKEVTRVKWGLSGPQSKITVILDTFRERTPRGKPCEDRKRLEWCCHKPKDATDHWPRPELKRGREGLSSRAVVPNLFGTRDQFYGASKVAQMVKNRLAMQETQVWSLGQEDTLEKRMAIHSSILVWRSPWTEEPGGLQSMGSQSVRHD